MSDFHAPISAQIWDSKYRFKEADGTPVDGDVGDSWMRIARALASAEENPQDWVDPFYDALEGFKFLPAGRITAGAGTGRSVTLFNCFVMGTVPDSMSGIFDMLKEAALTMQQGGGIGYDFSTIRPKGSAVKGVAADASGPLSFMDVWDAMCRTIMSAGSRRGAMMATMRCDHPDIMDFITAKKDPTRLRMFNLSVLITDKFMRAVEADEHWQFRFNGKKYHKMRARALWDAIMESTYAQAEPGVIFIDRINQTNNLRAVETIAATNPCGEQPLPPYGACLLGSINLAALVEEPFTDRATINGETLRKLVTTAVRMMDNVVDVSKFPLPAQRDEALAKRRIGLGVTGLADALAMMRITYGSDQAVGRTEDIMRFIDVCAYRASVALAAEKGAYPLFSAEEVLDSGTHASTLDEETRTLIREHGLRNALLTSIAPTGTISLYAGNVSSGIEPIFAYNYTRKVLQKDGSKTEELVEDYAVAKYRELLEEGSLHQILTDPEKGFDPEKDLPEYFVSAQTLTPTDHVRMQAAAQQHVDSSISKTINVPEDIDYYEFKEVYMEAYRSGCKGCTTYRPNEVTGSVLSVDTPESKKPEVDEESWLLALEALQQPVPVDGPENPVRVVYAESEATEQPRKRPELLTGATYKIRFGADEHAIYVTMTDIEEDGRVRPFEIFINSKNMEHFAWTVGLTRMISAVFRRPHDSTFVVEELKAVFDPKGGAWMEGEYVPSVLAAIGGVIEKHMHRIGYLPGSETPSIAQPSLPGFDAPTPTPTSICPKCFGTEFKKESGCETCLSCGHSKCG